MSSLESPEADSKVEQEFLGHVRVEGTEEAEAQADVQVVGSEVFGAELQAQVGVGEPVRGLEAVETPEALSSRRILSFLLRKS